MSRRNAKRMTLIDLNVNNDPHIRLTKSGPAWRDINHLPWEEFHTERWLPCDLCGESMRSGFTPDGGRKRFCSLHFRLFHADGREMRKED